MKILFVCLGNICRSPMAEAVFAQICTRQNLPHQADSAGTAAYHIGESPDWRTIRVLRENNIRTHHRAQKLDAGLADKHDLIVAMDHSNYADILEVAPAEKVVLMRDYDDLGKGMDVPDPYYGHIGHFREVYRILERSCEKFIQEIDSQ